MTKTCKCPALIAILMLAGCAGTAQVGDQLTARAGSTAAQINGAFCGSTEPIKIDLANSTDHVLTGAYEITTPDGRTCRIELTLESQATAAQQATNDAVTRALEAVLSRIPVLP